MNTNVLPQQFLERLKLIIPEQKLDEVLHSFSVFKLPTFRANTIKITADELEERLQQQNIRTQRVEWYKDAFVLINVPQRVLTETEEYKNGMLYIQSLSSMIPPLVLDPQHDEKIFDITAAPGSKTTQMAMLMNNTGEIVANDKSRVRLYKLEANLKLQGITNTKIIYKPAQLLWKDYPEYFDKTLVDVPCSMEGRFNTQSEKTYRDWSLSKIKYLEGEQRFILRSAVSATKVGGTIIYSTCTISPEENEGVIDWILKKEKGAVAVEDITLQFPNRQQGLTKWKNTQYLPNLAKTLRILPSEQLEGFYIAKLRKVASTITSRAQSA